MLTEKQFASLKKGNLSVDTQKSMDRISLDFKAASSGEKAKIVALSGLTRTTFYNAFQKGTASPRMVLSMSQLLGVSPYYYTGESDEKSEMNEEVLSNFLREKQLIISTRKKAGKATEMKATEMKAAGKKAAAKKPVKDAAPKKTERTESVETEISVAPAKTTKDKNSSDEILMQISIEKNPKLQKAVASLDEESAVLLFRALIRKADANDNARALCDVIKSCLLS